MLVARTRGSKHSTLYYNVHLKKMLSTQAIIYQAHTY